MFSNSQILKILVIDIYEMYHFFGFYHNWVSIILFWLVLHSYSTDLSNNHQKIHNSSFSSLYLIWFLLLHKTWDTPLHLIQLYLIICFTSSTKLLFFCIKDSKNNKLFQILTNHITSFCVYSLCSACLLFSSFKLIYY